MSIVFDGITVALGWKNACVGLAAAYQAISVDLGCHSFDSSTVTSSSRVDGVHLDRDQHYTLGEALANVVIPLLDPA
jgi:hypothetical protein